jgi:hypothetical protein
VGKRRERDDDVRRQEGEPERGKRLGRKEGLASASACVRFVDETDRALLVDHRAESTTQGKREGRNASTGTGGAGTA